MYLFLYISCIFSTQVPHEFKYFVTLFVLFFQIYFLKFIYFEGVGRGRERIPNRLQAVSAEPDMGLELTNCEIMTQGEIRSQTLNRHPGTLNPFVV